MCGFTALFGLDHPLSPTLAHAIAPMNGAIRHRGPDADGFFGDPWAALGHRRLSIIDVSGGGQPMANEDGTVWIVFNGEVYNHHGLRQILERKGHRFRTRSDTEAILHAYEEYGTATPEHLEGMFSFVIYDQKKRELFAARDRLGKKPLFYTVLDGALHLGSEMKSFYASPAWRGDVDLSALESYLSLGYFLAPDTVYRGVSKLPPAHWLHARNGQIVTGCYWDVTDFDSDRRGAGEIIDDLDTRLRHAVGERLESEVPLGAFLSGGIDSGLVVSYMAEAMSSAPITASVGFGGSAHNELAAAAITAGALGTQHYPHTLTPSLDGVFNRIVGAFDEPFADASAVPTYYVSQAAREHVTVALSGDGGDESFSGYDFRYVPHAVEQRLRRLVPGAPGRRAMRALGRAWPGSPRLPKPLRLKTIFGNLSRDGADAYYFDLCFMKPAATRRLMGLPASDDVRDSPVYEAVTAPYRRCPSPSGVQRSQYADLKVYLPNDVLVKVDRMSMLHSLEVRCPLLDRRIVEFAFRIPFETKMPRLQAKYLLRSLAQRRLPPALSTMPKLGFTAPVGDWLRGPYAGAFQEEVLRPGAAVASLVDVEHLRSLFRAHQAGSHDYWYPLWATWVLERWHAQRHDMPGRVVLATT